MNDNYPPGVTEDDISREFGGEDEERDEDEYKSEEEGDEKICTRSPKEMLAVSITLAIIIILCFVFPHGFK